MPFAAFMHRAGLLAVPPDDWKQLFFADIGDRAGSCRAESDSLLAFLFRHIETPEFPCRFRWERDSVAFWDNRSTQHHALWDYYPATRSGTRVTIMGDRPFFRA
jgi:alpha-ketoglutarate-dependent taurine dioxygenase